MQARRGSIRYAGLILVLLASMIMGQSGGCPSTEPRVTPCSQEAAPFFGGDLVTLDGSRSSAAGNTELAYQWMQLTGTPVVLSDLRSAIITFIAPNVTETLTFQLTVTDVFNATDVCVASVEVQCVLAAIGEQPADQTVCAGEAATFAITADSVSDVTYRWQHRAVEGIDWVDLANGATISGADTPTLTISQTDSADAGSYRCVVTSSCGDVISEEASLFLRAPTTIVTQPIDRRVVLDGEVPVTVTFSVTASGSGTLTYQWRRGGVNIVNGGGYSGATARTLRITDVSPNHEGSYRCVVTGDCGSVTSAAATLTIDVPG